MKGPVHQILKAEGLTGLMQLPGIGRSLAHTVAHLVRSGRVPLLERLREDHAGERIFATVPDVGTKLARRIHQHLGIETLAELETAANDGRLAQVPGMGRKRIRAVRESLAGRFARRRLQQRLIERQGPADQTSVAELLDIDDQDPTVTTLRQVSQTKG